MFTAEQTKLLEAPLSRSHVRERVQGGRNVSYIEGWQAIKEANRIFGFDGWTRETIDLRCVAEKEREMGQSKTPGWGVTYIARVRVRVGEIIREGSGTGHGIDRDLGQAHESALKEAETDAMKRALMTFGNPFGLALYDKDQTNVTDDAPDESRAAYMAMCEAAIEEAQTATALEGWWNGQKQRRRDIGVTDDELARLKNLVAAKLKTFKKEKEAA